jgi:hypothetical protein
MLPYDAQASRGAHFRLALRVLRLQARLAPVPVQLLVHDLDRPQQLFLATLEALVPVLLSSCPTEQASWLADEAVVVKLGGGGQQ